MITVSKAGQTDIERLAIGFESSHHRSVLHGEATGRERPIIDRKVKVGACYENFVWINGDLVTAPTDIATRESGPHFSGVQSAVKIPTTGVQRRSEKSSFKTVGVRSWWNVAVGGARPERNQHLIERNVVLQSAPPDVTTGKSRSHSARVHAALKKG